MSVHRRTGRAREWAQGHPFFVALLVFALIASVGFWRTQQIADQTAQTSQQQARDNTARTDEENAIVRALRGQLRCTNRTLAAYTERTKNLTPKANARLNDLFAALDAALAGNQRKARRIYDRASRENRAYLRYVAAHPVPNLHRCAAPNLPPPPPSPSRPSPPTTPHPTPTVTVTRTVTVPGPGVTRTVVIRPAPVTRVRTVTVPPGKGSAVTRTATVTVTAANPLCTVVPGVDPC